MESASGGAGVGTQSSQNIDKNNSKDWENALSGGDDKNNGWKIEISVKNNDNSQAVSNNNIEVGNKNELPPEVRKVLQNLIGNMGIEMVKTQNPAQKINMGEDKE